MKINIYLVVLAWLVAMVRVQAQTVTLMLSDGVSSATAQTTFESFTGALTTSFTNDGTSTSGGGWTVDFGTNTSPFGFIGGNFYTGALTDINQTGTTPFTRTHSSGFSYSVTMWGLTSNPTGVAAGAFNFMNTEVITDIAVGQSGDMIIERYGGALGSRGVQQGSGSGAGSSLASQITEGSTNALWGFDTNATKTETPNRTDVLLFQFSAPLTTFGFFGTDWESSPNNPSKYFLFNHLGQIIHWNTFTWTGATTFGNNTQTYFGITTDFPVWAIAFAVGNDDNNVMLNQFQYDEAVAIGGFTFRSSEVPEPAAVIVLSFVVLLVGVVVYRSRRGECA